MRIFATVCIFTLQNCAKSEFIDGEVTERVVCNGSVTIFEGSNKTVVTEDGDIKATIDLVKVDGCRCFTLYSRRGGKGKSFFLGGSGNYSRAEVGWSKVKSVWRAPCDRMAMPGWVVMLCVLGIVSCVGLAVFGVWTYKKKKNATILPIPT
jgi:hypothetical protein